MSKVMISPNRYVQGAGAIHNEPFVVTAQAVYVAIIAADALGRA